MSNGLGRLPKYMKRGLAATLFTIMLVGSCAAALSALAAAVSALSGNYNIGQRQMATSTQVSVTPSTIAPTEHVSSEAQATGQRPPVAASADVIDQLNAKVDRMHSPIQQTLDYGGVVLGDKVQQSFGQILSGLLQTLFVEQNPPSQQGEAN